MNIYGYTSNTTSFVHNVNIGRDFKYNIKTAMKWNQLSSGNYRATDRGYESDIYESEITVYDTFVKLCEIANDLYNVRYTDGNLILYCTTPGEDIFGKHVKYYPSISVIATEIGNPEKSSLNLYSLKVNLRLSSASMSFTGTSEFPKLWRLDTYSSEHNDSQIKIDDYSSYYYLIDPDKDTGTFKGKFIFSNSEIQKLMNWYYITNRSTTAIISKIHGLPYIFGSRSYSKSSIQYACYPANVKLISMDDYSYYNANYTSVNITLAEENT